MRTTIIYLPGGHVYFDRKSDEWVALSCVLILGRFKTQREAIDAVEQESERYREVLGGGE